MNAPSSPRRRWYQFSLRTMFVLVTLVSIPLAWVGYQFAWIRERRATLERIMEGGHYSYYGYTNSYELVWDDTGVPLPQAIREMLGDLPVTEIVLPEALKTEEPKIRQLFPGVEISFMPAHVD